MGSARVCTGSCNVFAHSTVQENGSLDLLPSVAQYLDND